MPSCRRTAEQAAHEEEDDLDIPAEPPKIDPYATLEITASATAEQIRSAYRRLALRHHPDKAAPADQAAAHTKFQEIAFAYAVLSDERRRRRYDATGRTEESLAEDSEEGEFDWAAFYREQFTEVVTAEKIEEFAREYKGSEEEREAVLRAYARCEGDMEALYEDIMLSDAEVDEERFRGIIDAAIESGEVEAFAKYTKEGEKKRNRRIQAAKRARCKEAKEAEELAEKLGLTEKMSKAKSKKGDGDTDGLAALIQQRQKGRAENFLADLEAKYAPKPKKGKRPIAEEPPEEAFAKTASKKTKKPKKA